VAECRRSKETKYTHIQGFVGWKLQDTLPSVHPSISSPINSGERSGKKAEQGEANLPGQQGRDPVIGCEPGWGRITDSHQW
jgi:hypothetical protein